VIEIGHSGLSKVEFDYATPAHLDFVVVDDDDMRQIAIELDGPQHEKRSCATG
jgi:hypothetical protein